MNDMYGGKYKPKTNLKLGKACKAGDSKCETRRRSFYSSIAKMKNNTSCPDGSFIGIPSQSLRNLVGQLRIPKRKNKPKIQLCQMLKNYEKNKGNISIMNIRGLYKTPIKKDNTYYDSVSGINYINPTPVRNNFKREIDPAYRSYDFLVENDVIPEIPKWLDDRRKGIKKTKKKRGRPKKVIEEVVKEQPKKPLGRPKKETTPIVDYKSKGRLFQLKF